MSNPDPNDPQPTPGNPNPGPARPPIPPETPPPHVPPGVPPPSPDPVPSPGEEPVQIPPDTPPEIPSEPRFPGPTASIAGSFLRPVGAAIMLAGALSLPGVVDPAKAQSDDAGAAADTLDPCQVEPGDDTGETTEGRLETRAEKDHRSTAELLERCAGVLSPPPTGDPGIEMPPPDTGSTPVIPPGSVPAQPPG